MCWRSRDAPGLPSDEGTVCGLSPGVVDPDRFTALLATNSLHPRPRRFVRRCHSASSDAGPALASLIVARRPLRPAGRRSASANSQKASKARGPYTVPGPPLRTIATPIASAASSRDAPARAVLVWHGKRYSRRSAPRWRWRTRSAPWSWHRAHREPSPPNPWRRSPCTRRGSPGAAPDQAASPRRESLCRGRVRSSGHGMATCGTGPITGAMVRRVPVDRSRVDRRG